ncbi:hypothetical protein [Aquamicrobium sp. LC103]|uniref:hypothetical protein n=1 Tax=Aquamicrobium sp. LC103 TaxID=1120658 RepID=UPI00063E909C|nr:hypothetical protein [Aquamicrobium sp. LC103]TKT74878.1 hypothetical protein XW59_020570 [Aquamicrobium sp. LC103]
MISARETLSSIERAILGVRAEEDRLIVTLRSAEEEAARLRTHKADGFKALATVRLEMLMRDKIVRELDAAERQALELIERRRRKLDDVADRRARATVAATVAEANRAEKARAVEKAGERIDEFTARIEAKIRSEPAWTAQEQRVAEAEAKAAAAADKATQAETDRESKGKPYRDDPLFMYLWRAGYGTSEYRAGAITRYFDGKVALLLGYNGARTNYHMLNEIPLRLREHADRVAAMVDDEIAKRSAIERQALEAEGIAALEKELEAAEKALDTVESNLEEARNELAALDEEQGREADAGDPDYRRAVQILAERLSREDLRTLYDEAVRTPTPKDEQIVDQLGKLDQSIARADAEIQQVRSTAAELARKRLELEQSRGHFRQRGYGDPLGEFTNGDVIGTVIGGILKGALSSRNLDDVLNEGFRRRMPRSPGGFGGGLRLPRGGSWGGGISLPQGRSSGGGGFRTGGRF